ncbi:MAG: hypothetical protein HQL32_14850 [Planctomycetes bacterium]|nr:hypothetical protein [Planctomycetota bacterium]
MSHYILILFSLAVSLLAAEPTIREIGTEPTSKSTNAHFTKSNNKGKSYNNELLKVEFVPDSQPQLILKHRPEPKLRDLDSLDAEGSLNEFFSEEMIKRWFSPEQWLTLYQRLELIRDYDKLIHLSILMEYMVDWPDEGDDFYKGYFQCQDKINDLSNDPQAQQVLLSRFYEKLAWRLRNMANQRNPWGLSAAQFIEYNTNVNQMPSGEEWVSEIAGFSSQSEVGAKYTTKDYATGQCQFEIGALTRKYFKKELELRDYDSLKFNVDHQYQLDHFFALGGVTLDVHADYLNTTLKKEHSNTSITPGLNFITRSKKFAKKSFLDSLTGAAVIYFEKRYYHGSESLDQNNRSKDLDAIHLNGLLLGQKKVPYGDIFTSLSLAFRQQYCDARDLHYSLYQLGWYIQLHKDITTYSLSTNYSERKQDDYQSYYRNDRTFTFRSRYSRELTWKNTTAELSYQFTNQNSNLNLMPFDDHYLSMGLTWHL